MRGATVAQACIHRGKQCYREYTMGMCGYTVTEWYGSSGVPLEDEPFYHGYMERKETERCLTKNGEFLVRKSVIRNNEGYIVSVRDKDQVLHLQIQEINPQKLYWLLTYCFLSISDLIRYHQTLKIPVYEGGVMLQSHIVREQWQLYHEQVDGTLFFPRNSVYHREGKGV
ncbi:hypothetical protein Y032_0278g1163 [Ancylostoma ceylanicum]|nr:hypothetical protein Y032_0278g1163 [Ancylostoma ceylanicum]